MKIVVYVRVSTNDQTIENQRLRLTEYADSKGWQYEIFSEVQSTRNSRPVKAELLNRLRNHEYDGLLVYKLDRYARSFAELILEISELIKKGIFFYSYSENLDFSTATGKLHFQILSAFAEFERSLISERTKEGITGPETAGKYLGGPKGQKTRNEGEEAVIYSGWPAKNRR